MAKINTEVRDNYPTYETHIGCKKFTSKKVIPLRGKKKSRLDFYYETETLTDENGEYPVLLVIEKSIRIQTKYKFQLLSRNFTQPIFRFDSDGPAHFNVDPKTKLKDKRIDTPHFNRYDQDGRGIAYRSDEIENDNELVKHLNNTFVHFCKEANIRFPADDFSEIDEHPGQLPLSNTTEDLLADVVFM